MAVQQQQWSFMAAVSKNQIWQYYRSTKAITIDGRALAMIIYSIVPSLVMIIYGGSRR